LDLSKEIEDATVIALDTTVFIYYIEKNQKYFTLLDAIFKRSNLKSKPIKILTSSITLIEVMVKPIRENRLDLVEQYEDILLSSDNVFVLMLESSIAKKSAELRAKYSFLRTPDSIQLATALCGGASLFITNDRRLKEISDIKSLLLDEMLINV